jgi:hypothetical protein
MARRIEITDDEVEKLTRVCLVVTKTMCATLLTHNLPCSPAVADAIAKSITTSLTDSFVHGRFALDKFN